MSDSSQTRASEQNPDPREDPTARSLLEHLLADQRHRHREGRVEPVEFYLQQHPALSENREDLLDLVYHEIVLRDQDGQTPLLEEYQQRFPELGEELQIQFEIDNALERTQLTEDSSSRTGTFSTSEFSPRPEGLTPPKIAGYEILGELGRGGMGIVYKAKQSALGRVVALKMILTSSDVKREGLARFRTEAEAIARLQHPNIVQIHEVGECRGNPYFSLEFCAGGTLQQKLRSETLTPEEAASLTETLARAMHVAHGVHVLHRDLKPANVLLTHDGIPKITDFGLAKKLDDEGQTQSGAVMGTPSYMAPEQAQGNIRELGPSADVYALGAILYECLIGKPPFKAATVMETLMQVISDEPASPKQLNRTIPVDLETICMKCLHKQKGERYASALALAEDLRRYQNGEPIHARPISGVQRIVKWAKRRPSTAALLGVSLVALMTLVGLLVASYFQLQLRSANQRLLSTNDELNQSNEKLGVAQQREQQARLEADRQRERAEKLLYFTDMRRASRDWREGDIPSLTNILQRHKPGRSGQPDRRGFEWYYLHGMLHGERSLLTGHSLPVWCVRYSPDGRWLASASLDGDIRIWNAESGKLHTNLREHSGSVLSIAFSPSGKHLASASADGTVAIWDWKTGDEYRTFDHKAIQTIRLAYHPDGKSLACCYMSEASEGTLQVWDIETQRELLSRTYPQEGPGITHDVSYSKDGKLLVVATASGRVLVFDAKSYEELARFQAHSRNALSVRFHPDGKQLATSGSDHRVNIWHVEGWRLAHSLSGHTSYLPELAYSADGRLLVSAGADAKLHLWDASSGLALGSIRGHRGAIQSCAVHPDGRTVATGGDDHTTRLWDTTHLPEYRPLANPSLEPSLVPRSHEDKITSIAYQPQKGRTLASCGFDGRLAMWDTEARALLWQHQQREYAPQNLAYTHQGESLAVACDDKSVRVYATNDGSLLRRHSEYPHPLLALACSPTQSRFATAERDGTVRIRNVATGEPIFAETIEDMVLNVSEKEERFLHKRIAALAYHPDGEHLALAFSYTDEAGHLSFAVDPDTLEIVPGPYVQVRVLHLPTGTEVLRFLEHREQVLCLAYSPRGKWLASADRAGKIHLYDAKTGTSRAAIEGHRQLVNGLAFSPDGSRLLSASVDTLRLWDTETGLETMTLFDRNDQIEALSFSPDGNHFATAGVIGSIRIW